MIVDPDNQSEQDAGADNQAQPERLLSRGEAARYLGVPVNTVYQWARTGRLPYKVTLGGHLRFSRRDLDAAVARDRSRPPDQPLSGAPVPSRGEPGPA